MLLALFAVLCFGKEVAIIVCGAPRESSLQSDDPWEESDPYYPMMSDTFRMASIFENNGYSLHLLFADWLADRYSHTFYNIETVRNWMLSSTGELYTCPYDVTTEEKVCEALRSIDIQPGDRVIVYLRSHGFQSGTFVGPHGARMSYSRVIKALTRVRGVEFLWIVECCFSGSIVVHFDHMFLQAYTRYQITSTVVTSTSARCKGWGGYARNVPAKGGRRHVTTSGIFRHDFIYEIQREGGSFTEVLTRIQRRYVLPWTFSYGSADVDSRNWIRPGTTFYEKPPLLEVKPSAESLRTLLEGCENCLARRESEERFEQWEYGNFSCSSSDCNKAYQIALADHRRFKTLVEGSKKLLGIEELPRRGRLSVEQFLELAKLTNRMNHFLPDCHHTFVRDEDILRRLILARPLLAIENAFRIVSKVKHLVPNGHRHARRRCHRKRHMF